MNSLALPRPEFAGLDELAPAPPERRLFVLDTEAPWIRSLLQAMPAHVKIFGFRVRNCFSFPGGYRALAQKVGRSERVSENWIDTCASVPGWHRAFGLSSWLISRQVKKAMRAYGRPDAMLFTLPWYAQVAENCRGMTKAYYAHDTFRFYDWNRAVTIGLEARLLRSCDVGFGVARRVVEDLRADTTTPVHYLPMATGWRMEASDREGAASAKADFQTIPRPRVGCVGQINRVSYDWDLIEHLSGEFPTAQFVFIGPRFKEQPGAGASKVDSVFARPNVHWLGPKPHAHLPDYLRQCDVLINPLLVNEHNHRRSLLRLFDYLTTDRPIISSAMAEAFNHQPHVSVAKDKSEYGRLLGQALSLNMAPQLESRRNYVAANTWQVRANDLLQHIGLLAANGSSHGGGRRRP